MAQIKIEMDRGNGWEIRAEGAAEIDAAGLAEKLAGYALQYPHRAFLDGVLIANAKPVRGKFVGKVTLV